MIELAHASIHIDAPQSEVFALFTTESGLCSWMAKEATIDLRPGGRWRWVHDNDVAASGEYVVVTPCERVVFTYGWETGPYAEMAPGSTMVEVTFVVEGDGTTVTVDHSAVPEVFRAAHSAGWGYFLGVLAEVARDGGTVGGEGLSMRLPPRNETDDFDTETN